MDRIKFLFLAFLSLHALTGSVQAAKRVAILVTSNSKIPGIENESTGYWGEELTGPYQKFLDEGFEITVLSPKGGVPPLDPRSSTPSVQAFLAQHPISSVPLAEWLQKSPQDRPFDGVFIVGGHGLIWDLADPNTQAGKDAQAFLKLHLKRPIAAVCHGPAVLANLKDGSGYYGYFLSGKDVTGFSEDEEDQVDASIIPGMKNALEHSALKGSLQNALSVATMAPPKFLIPGGPTRFEGYAREKPWHPYIRVDGKLVTGQNPASSIETAQALVALIEYNPTSLVTHALQLSKRDGRQTYEIFLKSLDDRLKDFSNTRGDIPAKLQLSLALAKEHPEMLFDYFSLSAFEYRHQISTAKEKNELAETHTIPVIDYVINTGKTLEPDRAYSVVTDTFPNYRAQFQNTYGFQFQNAIGSPPSSWQEGHTTVFVGMRDIGIDKKTFLHRLTDHVNEAATVFYPHGLRWYVVYSTEDYEIAFMNWESEQAMMAAMTSDKGKAVVADAGSILKPAVWSVAKPFTGTLEPCGAALTVRRSD